MRVPSNPSSEKHNRRRVLIVVSSYAPAMIADMHRARQLAWELPKLGWDVEIITPDASYQKSFCLDSDSEPFFSPDIHVHYVGRLGPNLFGWLGLSSIGWRALPAMLLGGQNLLSSKRFDLVYFSTTQFSLFLLGPIWGYWHQIPYILDVHDPVCRDDRRMVWASNSLKHRVNRWLMCRIESWAVKCASGLVAVSSTYIDVLRKRYASYQPLCLRDDRTAAIPFGVLPVDFNTAFSDRSSENSAPSWQLRIVYVGAGGLIMRRSFGLFCQLIAKIRLELPATVEGLKFELFGTQFGWREGDPCHLQETADMFGISDLVVEDPRRLTYRQSLNRLVTADGVLILGVEDDGYMPSKLFGYSWSGMPLFAVLRRRSPSYQLLERNPELGHAIWFDREKVMPEGESMAKVMTFLMEAREGKRFDRCHALSAYTSSAMANRHAELFARSLAT